MVYPLRQASASAAGWLGGGGGVGAPEGLSEAKARSLAAEDLKNATDQVGGTACVNRLHVGACVLVEWFACGAAEGLRNATDQVGVVCLQARPSCVSLAPSDFTHQALMTYPKPRSLSPDRPCDKA